MKHILLIAVMINLVATAFSQPNCQVRFRDLVFDDISISRNGYYNQDVPAGVKKKSYKFDLYQPKDDTARLRPVIIWLHGGGFKLGNKKSRGVPGWSKRFAKRGFVCVAINYRKSKKKPLSEFPDLVEGCYDAITDLKLAVDFLKEKQQLYRIDTTRIILGGNSAGGMIALQAVYSSPADLFKYISPGDTGTKKGTLFFEAIPAVINFWGGIFDTSWLKHASVPIVSVHGAKDNIVPYKQEDTPLSGSYLVHQKAGELNIPNRLKTYEKYRHELQLLFNPFFALCGAHKRWKEAGQFAADFLHPIISRE